MLVAAGERRRGGVTLDVWAGNSDRMVCFRWLVILILHIFQYLQRVTAPL